MNEPVKNTSAHRLGFMIPMILFVLFFVACCGVLVSLFVRSTLISTRAGQVNDAVQICRNEAERFRSGEELPEILYFSEDYRESSPESAKYCLNIQLSRETTPSGILLTARMTASSMDGEAIYTMDTARYVPGGR